MLLVCSECRLTVDTIRGVSSVLAGNNTMRCWCIVLCCVHDVLALLFLSPGA